MFVFMSVVVNCVSVWECFLCSGRGCDVCIMRRGEVLVYGKCECVRHADIVCLCLVCILWQFTMLHSA